MDKQFAKEYHNSSWKEKRNFILRRDQYTCQICGRTEEDGVTLQVHHLIYLANCKPWEYPNYAYITLCSGCHAAEHGHKIPTSGWIYDNEYDYGYYGAEQCQLCGADLRYVHVLHHPNWGSIMVGCECETKLLEGDNTAVERKNEREKFAEKLKRFINSPMWKQKKNGYFYKKDGVIVRIWDNTKYYSITYQYVDDEQQYRLKGFFHSLIEAKYRAFEMFYAPQRHESKSYPNEEILVCSQPTNLSDRRYLIRNICAQIIKNEKKLILPKYNQIESRLVQFIIVRNHEHNDCLNYDLKASLIGKKDNIMYDFYIRFVFGETLPEQEIYTIKEKNVQYICVDCSNLLEGREVSMEIIRDFLYSNSTRHSQWIHSPIYDAYSAREHK